MSVLSVFWLSDMLDLCHQTVAYVVDVKCYVTFGCLLCLLVVLCI